MVKYINDYKAGKTKDGFFITFMGSGIPSYITGIANQTKDLGPEYQPVAFLTFGKSYGEDQVIGPEDVKRNPQLLKGMVIRGVRMDGDLDIFVKFCGDNGVPVNANDKIYMYDAANLSYSKDFLSAVVDYNTGVKETRKIAINGKTTGKDTTVSYDLVATWTPGDVNAVSGKGGVTIISTRQYASIMPNITITCKKFLNDNRTSMEGLVVSLAQAGDQIRSYDDVKKYVSTLSAEVWNEQDAAYWYKYYNGVQHNKDTYLGGSMVFNLADMAKMFGLNGGQDVYKAVYNTFGTIQSKLYPQDLPTYLEYSKAVDKSIIRSVMDNHPELLEGKTLDVKYNDKITETVASKSWSIEFNTGSDDIKPSSYKVLEEILEEVTTSEGLKVGVYGHTDNTGSDVVNIPLSEKRAEAVAKYLIAKGLPANRFETQGFGSTQPVADNTTAAGKAKNRRVQIVLGN
jgi:outer membrane protein OmpA-like peptidoglycan-associated protein